MPDARKEIPARPSVAAGDEAAAGGPRPRSLFALRAHPLFSAYPTMGDRDLREHDAAAGTPAADDIVEAARADRADPDLAHLQPSAVPAVRLGQSRGPGRSLLRPCAAGSPLQEAA